MFAAYKVRVEGLYEEVDDLVMYIIVTCDENASVAAADRVMHRNNLQANIKFIFKVRSVNIITRTCQ